MTAKSWIILIAIVVGLIIFLDEVSYLAWKKRNPGAQWSGVTGITAPLVDPNTPPRSWG